MLNTTKQKLDALYEGGEHRGMDGKLHRIDSITRISREQGEKLAEFHRSVQPELSIEIGLAYGFSTLYLLDSMQEGRYGRHVAIDPAADDFWHGVGLAAITSCGLAERFEWIKETSFQALPQLARKKERAQFVYIDGCHLFDYALVDFCLSDVLVDVGGLILLDDLWMGAIKKVVKFIENNMTWYQRVETHVGNLACFRKVGKEARQWDDFHDF